MSLVQPRERLPWALAQARSLLLACAKPWEQEQGRGGLWGPSLAASPVHVQARVTLVQQQSLCSFPSAGPYVKCAWLGWSHVVFRGHVA